MPANPYEPPKEVGTTSSSWILWLVIGCSAVTVVAWPCLTVSLLALVPWAPARPGEDPVWAAHYEFQARIVLFGAISLPLAVIVGLAAMLVGNHRRRRA